MIPDKIQAISEDFFLVQKLAYEPNGLQYQNLRWAAESKDYAACSFEINNKAIQFRVARITPIKIGQFVTFWKRLGEGPIMPYDISNTVDLFIVSVRNGEYFGQFVFPKEVLFQKTKGEESYESLSILGYTQKQSSPKNSSVAAFIFF